MTNTEELNREICELCGIKPQYYYVYSGGEENTAYPDFGEPENFVKLFNLPVKTEIISYETIAEMIIGMQHLEFNLLTIRNIKDFLEALFYLLTESCEMDDEDIEIIKQAIRNAEWIY